MAQINYRETYPSPKDRKALNQERLGTPGSSRRSCKAAVSHTSSDQWDLTNAECSEALVEGEGEALRIAGFTLRERSRFMNVRPCIITAQCTCCFSYI